MYNTDLDRPIAEILNDVRNAGLTNAESASLKMGIIIIPFATLLVKLSQEADRTAQVMRTFTKWLLALTFALFFLTIALLAMQAYQIYQNDPLKSQSAESRDNGNQKPAH